MRTTRQTAYEFQTVTLFTQHKALLPLLFMGGVLILEIFNLLQPFRRFTEKIFVPVMSWSGQIVQTIELPYFMVRQSVRNYTYVQDLELRYAETISQLGELDALKKENQELHQLVEKPGTAPLIKPVIAPILAYSQPYIGKGQRDGVHTGDLVMIVHTLVGRVEEASELQSVVTLLTSSTSLPILVQTESGVTGVAVGTGNQVVMKEIPQDAHLQVGERITTIGQAEVPAGLSLGRIQSVSGLAVNSSQVAVIDQVVSFYQSHIVEVQPR